MTSKEEETRILESILSKLLNIELINVPMVDDGGGEFPTSYKLSEKNIEEIRKELTKQSI